jgi:hypothetical protein
MKCQADLFEIVDATRATSRLAGGLHGRQQKRDQHGDDGYDDEQLDERETAPLVSGSIRSHESLRIDEWTIDEV